MTDDVDDLGIEPDQTAPAVEPPPVDLRRAALRAEMTKEHYDQVVEETYALIDRRFEKVRALVDVNAPDVNLNPFLMLALAPSYNIFSPFEAGEWVQMSKLPHGDATAFGKFVEDKILPIFGVTNPAEKVTDRTKYSAIDKEVTVDGRRYLMTLKAGPWTMNQAHANEMNSTFPSIHEETGCDLIIGIQYGRADRVNNKPGLVRTTCGGYVHVLVGRAFWEFVTGIERAHMWVYRAIRDAQQRFAREHEGKTVYEHMIASRLELAASFRSTFALVGDDAEMWEQIFEGSF